MAQLNVQKKVPTAFTHEGAPAVRVDAETELRRAVMACLLWENSFYESGEDIAARIGRLVPQVDAHTVAGIAVEARTFAKLRHVPLLIVAQMAKAGGKHLLEVSSTLVAIIQRPDELGEFLAIYAKINGVAPGALHTGKVALAAQVKKGLARAFAKFDAYSLAKYNRDSDVQLKHVLFLVHSKPVDGGDTATKVPALDKKSYKRGEVLRHPDSIYTQLIDDKLPSPETWENRLSRGEKAIDVFPDIMAKKQLGALAFLRNLRNMSEAGVDVALIKQYAETLDVSRVLPFRFISAARAVPQFEPILEPLLFRAAGSSRLDGSTAIVIDDSFSMRNKVSEKSEVTRADAACAVAMIAREQCDDARVFAFSTNCREIPPRRGFALRDAVLKESHPEATMLGKAVRHVYEVFQQCQRLIVITDEQSADRPPHPRGRGYIVNVEAYQNGIGYGPWVTINGWSEQVLEYIRAVERMDSEVGAEQ